MSWSPRPSGTTPSPVCLPSLCVRTRLCVPTSCSPISTMQARDSPRKLAISECRGLATCTLASRVIGTLSVFRSYCLVCVRAARGNRELLAFAGARERGASILPLLGPCHTPWPLSHSFGPERLTSALCRGKSHVLPSGLRIARILSLAHTHSLSLHMVHGLPGGLCRLRAAAVGALWKAEPLDARRHRHSVRPRPLCCALRKQGVPE